MSGSTKDFAACVILDDEGRVLLVHHTYRSKEWTLPGGVVEDGEPSWEAMKRECREEIGVEVEGSLAGVPAPDGEEIDAIGYFSLEQLPSPMSNFTIQRIEDVLGSGAKVCLRTQHIGNYRIGDPESIRQ